MDIRASLRCSSCAILLAICAASSLDGSMYQDAVLVAGVLPVAFTDGSFRDSLKDCESGNLLACWLMLISCCVLDSCPVISKRMVKDISTNW